MVATPNAKVSEVNWQDPRKKVAMRFFTPMAKGVLCQAFREETFGSLVLPENTKSRPVTPTALVIAVGPDVKQVKEGDQVVVSENTLGTLVIGPDRVPCGLFQEEHLCGVVETAYRITLPPKEHGDDADQG